MKNRTNKNWVTAAVFSITSLGLSMQVSAGSVSETLVQGNAVPQKTVSYSQAELTTNEGREAVVHRIKEAAEDVCGPVDYRRAGGLRGVAGSRECQKKAVAQAMGQIDAARVAAR